MYIIHIIEARLPENYLKKLMSKSSRTTINCQKICNGFS